MMKKSFVSLWMVPILLLALLVACGPAATPISTPAPGVTPTPQPEILKIGGIGPLSGAAAPWGVECQRSLNLAAEEVNAVGGLQIGGKRYLLEIVYENDEFLASKAVTLANKLIFEDKVKFIFVLAGSSTLALKPIAEQNQVLLLATNLTKGVVSPDATFTFRMGLTARELASVLYPWLYSKYTDKKKVAVFAPDDGTGRGWMEDISAEWKAAGFQIVLQDFYARGTQDFYPLLTRALMEKADIIDGDGGGAGDIGLMIKQARELGFKGPMVSMSLTEADTVVKLAGKEATEDVYTAAGADPTSEIVKKVSPGTPETYEKYMAKFGLYQGAISYQPMYILMDAMKAANSVDPAKVRDAMEKLDYVGKWGRVKFGGKERYGLPHLLLGSVFVTVIHNGKFETIAYAVPEVP